MIEYVVNNAFAALPQRILHSNEDGSQSSPAIARLANGGFVTGWTSNSSVFVQRYDAQGAKVGGEQLIASGVYDYQLSLVGLSGGGFAAAWSGMSGVLARTFDASGNALSNTFSASTAPQTFQMQQPALGADANNGLIIAWSDSSGGGGTKIKARVFDALGTGTTGDIVVAAPPFSNSYAPQVSVQADGDFLVSWTGPYTRTSGESALIAANARLFDARGNAKSGVVSSFEPASVPIYHDGFYQSITTLKSGGFVMTWTDTGDGDTIRGQLYAADATPIGAQFQVNPADALAAGQSTVTALDNGGFLVTWRADTYDGGSNYFQRGDILAQAFNASAVKVGSAFRVNDNVPLGQDKPVVTAFGSGDFAFTFRTFTDTGESDVAIKLYYSATNGTAGNDTINGTADVDYINGLAGNDILNGGSSNDVLDGGAGNDTLNGGAGNDVLIGGAGDDSYVVDSQGDIIVEQDGEGRDSVSSLVSFYLYANLEMLTLDGIGDHYGVGNSSNNTIIGNAGSNLLLGGGGNDNINGLTGNDSLFGEAGNDILFGEFGVDYLVGGTGNDTLLGGEDPDALYGEDGDDYLDGGDTFDTDILVGGNGNDTLDGSSGLGDYDLLNGGPGDDIYFVDTPDDLTFEAAGEGTDTVYANINGAGYYLYAFTENLILEGNTPFGVGNELDNKLTGNTGINLGSGDFIVLNGVTNAQLSAGDFLFG